VAGRLAIWLLGLASVAALYVLGRLIPLASLLVGVWLPLPILAVGWRLGSPAAFLLAGGAVAALLLVPSGPGGLGEHLNLVELLLLGAVLSVLRQQGRSLPQAVAFGVAVLVVVSGGFLLLQGWLSGAGAVALLRQKADAVAAVLAQMAAEAGLESPGFPFAGPGRPEWGALILNILPALWVINTALVAWLNLVILRGWARARGEMDLEPPLDQWSAPEWLIFPFLAAGFLLLVPVAALRLAAVNLVLILGLVYFFQGLAVMAALYERFRLPGFLRLLGFLIAFMNPVFLVVTLVGLLDLWLDFRRLHRPRES
jgi:hypothetical protein